MEAVSSGCICPTADTHDDGTACVPDEPACPGGQEYISGACSCPPPSEWNGSECVTPTTCPGDMVVITTGGCGCPAGSVLEGADTCVVPTGDDEDYYEELIWGPWAWSTR